MVALARFLGRRTRSRPAVRGLLPSACLLPCAHLLRASDRHLAISRALQVENRLGKALSKKRGLSPELPKKVAKKARGKAKAEEEEQVKTEEEAKAKTEL